jgi:AraC-like DNA-binding protein
MSTINFQRLTEAKAEAAPQSNTFSTNKLYQLFRSFRPLVLIWWCFAIAIVCSSINRITGNSSGLVFSVLMIAGSGGCAWLWLLSRSLFRANELPKPWAFIVVGVVILIEAAAQKMALGPQTEFSRIFENAASMVCIAAIVFMLNEAMQGYQSLKSQSERRFRWIFMGTFAVIIMVAVLWVAGAGSESMVSEWRDPLLLGCGLLGLLGSRWAVQFRLNNPHPLSKSKKSQANHQWADKETKLLAEKIATAIQKEALLTKANLKISDLAEWMGEQEYKVTRCITSYLGYRNFNHLLNTVRIERAKNLLADSKNNGQTIAAIAFDCGFNSLGPFNRAFKEMVGLTPREFRQNGCKNM